MARKTWYVGEYPVANQNFATDIAKEKATTYAGYLGLINPTDYVRASTDSECTSVYQSQENITYPCKQNNYLYKSGYTWWTMNRESTNNVSGSKYIHAWYVHTYGCLHRSYYSQTTLGVRPVLYLIPSISLSGNGTSETPYIVQ